MSLRNRIFENGYPRLAAINGKNPGFFMRLVLWGAVLVIFLVRPSLAKQLLKDRSGPGNPNNDLYPLW